MIGAAKEIRLRITLAMSRSRNGEIWTTPKVFPDYTVPVVDTLGAVAVIWCVSAPSTIGAAKAIRFRVTFARFTIPRKGEIWTTPPVFPDYNNLS
jgi:hypothetical protein